MPFVSMDYGKANCKIELSNFAAGEVTHGLGINLSRFFQESDEERGWHGWQDKIVRGFKGYLA
ncbi:MAG: hypothetical protein AB4038_00965 [Prochloraceae cyanobacterium]